jgi:hypothetical protein
MKNFNFILVLALALIMVSCNSSEQKTISGFNIETSGDEEGDKNVKVSAEFDFGSNVDLGLIELPVFNPRNGITYGSFKMAKTIEGKNEISFKANLSQLLNLNGGRADLPNGSDLPYGGIESLDVIEIPVTGINAEIYVASKNGLILLGFAVSIKQLNGVGQYFNQPGAIFPKFSVNNFEGYAGVFTGAESGETGLGLFTVIESPLKVDAPYLISENLVNGSQKELLKEKMIETKSLVLSAKGASGNDLNNVLNVFNKIRERKYRHISKPAARRRMLRREKVLLEASKK